MRKKNLGNKTNISSAFQSSNHLEISPLLWSSHPNSIATLNTHTESREKMQASTAPYLVLLPNIHHHFNPNNHTINLKQRREGIKCCNSRRGKQADSVNYYDLLGVSVHSTPQEIKQAYRRLQKKHHPDVAGQKGHEYTLMLNEAYQALMRGGLQRNGAASGRKGHMSESNFSGSGFSSWNGPTQPRALFIDENKCIGCRECVYHASQTFMMDESLGCARVKVQSGDDEKKIEVSVDSCPVNCIHWVDSEELPVLEFLIRPQPKEANGVFGGGWERPANVFAAAKYFNKQSKQQESEAHQSYSGKAEVKDETPAQAKARYDASLKLQMEKIWESWSYFREQFLGQK